MPLDLDAIRARLASPETFIDLQPDVEALLGEVGRLRQELHDYEYPLTWPEGSLKRHCVDLTRALKIKAKQAALCEVEIERLRAVLGIFGAPRNWHYRSSAVAGPQWRWLNTNPVELAKTVLADDDAGTRRQWPERHEPDGG